MGLYETLKATLAAIEAIEKPKELMREAREDKHVINVLKFILSTETSNESYSIWAKESKTIDTARTKATIRRQHEQLAKTRGNCG